MAAIKFSESINISRNSADIFAFTQDYTKRLTWDTFLKKADLIDGATEAGKGVKAYCVARNGLGMVTEYITFNPPKATAIRMTSGPFLFKNFLGSWNFRQLTENSAEVIFLYSFELRFPFSLFSFIATRNLKANVKRRLRDLKACMEES